MSRVVKSELVAIRGLFARLHFKPLESWHREPGGIDFLALEYSEGWYLSSYDLFLDEAATRLWVEDIDALDSDPELIQELLHAPTVRTAASAALTSALREVGTLDFRTEYELRVMSTVCDALFGRVRS